MIPIALPKKFGRYEGGGGSTYNGNTLITPHTNAPELYTNTKIKIKDTPFEWCIKLFSILITYLVTDF